MEMEIELNSHIPLYMHTRICSPLQWNPPSLHLAVVLLVQQDVPGSNVSVDKGLTSQVRQTLSHLATELEQCSGQHGFVSPNFTAQHTKVTSVHSTVAMIVDSCFANTHFLLILCR